MNESTILLTGDPTDPMAPGAESPGLASRLPKPPPGELEELRRRNEELEKALRESREREEAARRDLLAALRRAAIAEEAEERLCSQLGELEAEAVGRARAHSFQIRALSDQLASAQRSLLLLP